MEILLLNSESITSIFNFKIIILYHFHLHQNRFILHFLIKFSEFKLNFSHHYSLNQSSMKISLIFLVLLKRNSFGLIKFMIFLFCKFYSSLISSSLSSYSISDDSATKLSFFVKYMIFFLTIYFHQYH